MRRGREQGDHGVTIAAKHGLSYMIRRVLLLACFLSGASALILESLWFRAAGFALGNSVGSAAIVLAGFMAGLAIGNLWASSYCDRLARPARAYVLVEVAIAVSGLAAFGALLVGQEGLAGLLRPLTGSPIWLDVARGATAFLILLVPASAMGATLPLVVVLAGESKCLGLRLGQLYAWNTMGAVMGPLVSEGYLVPWLGLLGAGVVAAGLNVLAAGLVCWKFRCFRSQVRPTATTAPQATRARLVRSWPVARLGGAAFLAGAAILALEVVWFRFLQLRFDATSMVFALLLAIVIGGLSLGSWLAGRLFRGGLPAPRALHVVLLLQGVLVIAGYYLSAGWMDFLDDQVQQRYVRLLLAGGLLILPVAVLSGFGFAKAGHALFALGLDDGQSTGVLVLCNTLGAMSGALLGGFVALPWLGMERSFFVAALMYGVAALVVPRQSLPKMRAAGLSAASYGHKEPSLPAVGEAVSRETTPARGMGWWVVRFRSWPRPIAVISYGAAVIFFPWGIMDRDYLGSVDRKLPDAKRVATHEGVTETALYYRHDFMGEPLFHRLVTHSYSMSSTDPRSRRYMKLFAWLPLALHPGAEDALLVCFGVGSTAQALVETEWLRSIDVVDISRSVLDLSKVVFPQEKKHPLRDSRVKVHVEDGRFFLHTAKKCYDLITAEPPPPKINGVVNLYTREFFETARARLKRGGMLTYWLPVYQFTEGETRSIMQAFLGAFPDATLWEGGGLNWILMGTRDATDRATEEQVVRQWRKKEVREEMIRLGLERPEQLGTTFLADAADMANWCAGAQPLSDLFPGRISADIWRRSPNSAWYREVVNAEAARERFERSEWIRGMWPVELRESTLACYPYQGMMNYALYPEHRPVESVVLADLTRVLRDSDLRTLPLYMLGVLPEQVEIAARQAAAAPLGATGLHAYYLGVKALVEGDRVRARELLEIHLASGLSAGQRAAASLILSTLSHGS